MKRKFKVLLTLLLSLALFAGCAQDAVMLNDTGGMSYADARKELDTFIKHIKPNTVKDPKMDIYSDKISELAALADIDTFDIVVEGHGDINIEIAAATELTSEAPDDWIIAVANSFNSSGATLNGKRVSVSIRQITSGEATEQINAGAYTPNALITSNDSWGKMIDAKGIGINMICDKIAGNTAGLLLSEDAYNTVIDNYGEVNIGTVITAAGNGEVQFGYPNPYTSTTGLNGVSAILSYFDPDDPLSAKASNALLEYQKTQPLLAYTTAVLSNAADKGLINAMLMEEQAYINKPGLRDYKYIPFGLRHDHPVYTFEWNTPEQNEVAQLFVDWCLSDENQKLATDKGFNRHGEYKSQDSGLSGQGYLTAQSLWKQNKTGGKPVIAVFVVDVSGSMAGERIAALQKSVTATLPYIGSEHYVGLVTYASDVTINLPIAQFDDRQRACFSGELQNVNCVGSTHTYDAVLVGLDLLDKKAKEIPDAMPVMFVLTDGEVLGGVSLNRITPVVSGMSVPIYSIAYNYDYMDELNTLSSINEASAVRADSSDIVTHLKNLFNTQL